MEYVNGFMKLNLIEVIDNKALFSRDSTHYIEAINPIFEENTVSWDWGHYWDCSLDVAIRRFNKM